MEILDFILKNCLSSLKIAYFIKVKMRIDDKSEFIHHLLLKLKTLMFSQYQLNRINNPIYFPPKTIAFKYPFDI